MADPASLAQRAGELAGEAGALARNLDALSQQLALSTQQAAHAGTPFVFELTIFAIDRSLARCCDKEVAHRPAPRRSDRRGRVKQRPAIAFQIIDDARTDPYFARLRAKLSGNDLQQCRRPATRRSNDCRMGRPRERHRHIAQCEFRGNLTE